MADYRELARKRAKERNTSNWYRLKEGDNSFRILPTPASKKTQGIWFEYAVHREVGPKKSMVRCGHPPATEEHQDQGSCWMCDILIPKIKAKGHDARAAALAPKDQFVLQVARVDEEGGMTGPFIFTPSSGVANQILNSILGSRKRDYVDAKKGYNISLNRTGTGKNDTRYGTLEPDVDQSEVPQNLITKLKPFSDLAEIPPYSEAKQKAAYYGTEESSDEDEDEDEDNEKLPQRPSHDESDEDDEEEDEDEKPKPSSKKPKSVVVDDEDEDEATPPPKKPKKEELAVAKPKKQAVVEEDEDEAPPPKKPKKPVVDEDEDEVPPPKKPKKPVVDEEDEDDISDIDDEDDEDEAPPPKKPKK